MKLVCPKCHLSLRVPDHKVPEAGAWARCPRCQERFFINPVGHSIADLTRPADNEPSAARAARPGQRDQSSQQLLDRLRSKQGRTSAADYSPELITVYPEAVLPEHVCRAASAIMLCLPLVAVLILFNTTNSRLNQATPRPEPSAGTVERLNDQDNPDLIRQDLLSIKRDHLRRQRHSYQVGHRGPESRSFKYFMSRLAPDVCAGVSHLQVSTRDDFSRADFTVTAFCLEPEGRRLSMEVEWVKSGSLIRFPYNKKSEFFPLYPDTARPTAPGSAPATAAAGSP